MHANLLGSHQSTCCFAAPSRNNPCLCGDIPAWLNNAISDGVYTTAGTGLGTPCNATLSTCPMNLPPAWLADAPALLALKAAAANPSALEGWVINSGVCTHDEVHGDCVLCDASVSFGLCGTLRGDGQYYCRWRYVECKAHRVTRIIIPSNQVHGAAVGSGCMLFRTASCPYGTIGYCLCCMMVL